MQQQPQPQPTTATTTRKRPATDATSTLHAAITNSVDAKRRKCDNSLIVSEPQKSAPIKHADAPTPWPVRMLYTATYGNDAVAALLIGNDVLDFYARRMITLCGGNALPPPKQKPATSPLSSALSSAYSSPFMARVLHVQSRSTFATIEGDYVKLMSARTKLTLIKYRAAGLDWASRFLECLKCSISTLSIAANLFDRFMYRAAAAGVCPTSVDDLSLSIIVVSQIAMLFNEDCRPRVVCKDLPKFVQTASGKPFTAKEVATREAQVLTMLKFNVHHYPTPRALLELTSVFLKQGILFYSGHHHHHQQQQQQQHSAMLPTPSASSSAAASNTAATSNSVFSMLQNSVVSPITNADITSCDAGRSAARFDLYCQFLCDLLLMHYDYLITHSPTEIVAIVGYMARWRWAMALLDTLEIEQRLDPTAATFWLPQDVHKFPLRLFDPPWPLCLTTILNVPEERLIFMARAAVKPIYQCLKHPYNLIKQYATPAYGGVAKLGIPDFSSLDE